MIAFAPLFLAALCTLTPLAGAFPSENSHAYLHVRDGLFDKVRAGETTDLLDRADMDLDIKKRDAMPQQQKTVWCSSDSQCQGNNTPCSTFHWAADANFEKKINKWQARQGNQTCTKDKSNELWAGCDCDAMDRDAFQCQSMCTYANKAWNGYFEKQDPHLCNCRGKGRTNTPP